VRDCVTMPPITHYALFGALVSNLPDLACPSRFRALRAKIEAAGGTVAIGGPVVTRTHAARDRTAHPVPVEKDDKQSNRWHERKPEPAYPFKRAGYQATILQA